MKTFNTLTALSAAFLMTAAIGQARAEDGDMIQAQTHERVQKQLNLQAPGTDYSLSPGHQQNRIKSTNQNQYQYRHMNDASTKHNSGYPGKGNIDASRMSRTMDRYNTMNRQSNMTRSMGGARR